MNDGRVAAAEPPRVVFVSHQANLVGGAQRSLVERVGRLADRGSIEPVVVVPGHGDLVREVERLGIRTHVVPLPHWTVIGPHSVRHRVAAATRWIPAVRAARRLLATVDADLVVTNTITVPSMAVAARLVGIPHIWSVHELLGVHPHGITTALPLPVALALVDRSSDRIWTNSAVCAAGLAARIHRTPIDVIEPGCEVSVRADPRGPRDPAAPIRLLHLGRVSVEKGVVTTLRALGEVTRRGVPARLRLVGVVTPTFRTRIDRILTDEGISDRVTVEPPTGDVTAVLDAADAVVVACPFESFGRVTVEAMRRGAVVIGADSGATADLLGSGRLGSERLGLLFDPQPEQAVASLADAIGRLWRDPALGAHLGRQALAASAERFDPTATAERVEAAILDCFEQRTDRPPATSPWPATATRVARRVRSRGRAVARRRAREDALDRFERARHVAGRMPGGTACVDAAAPFWLGTGVRIRGDLAHMRIAGSRIEAPRRFVRHAVLRAYEPLLTAWIHEHLPTGGVAVDVGAHVGLLTVPMAQRVGACGRVIAVEPGPDNAGHLARNLAANGLTNVEIVRCALDATAGERLLHLGQASDSYGFFDHPNAPTLHHLPVPTTTLDALLTGPDAIADHVDLVKIDAEGAEPEILHGAARLLAAHPDLALAVEWNPKLAASRGQPLDLLPTMLRNLGRELLVLDEIRGKVMTVEDALTDVEADPVLFRRWYANLVDA